MIGTKSKAKEKTAEEKSLKKSQNGLIHAIYRYQQYYSSACVKGDVRQVNQKLRKLKTPTAQYRFLRSNIIMRTIGFGGMCMYVCDMHTHI